MSGNKKDDKFWCFLHNCARHVYTSFSFCPRCEEEKEKTKLGDETDDEITLPIIDLDFDPEIFQRWEQQYGTFERWEIIRKSSNVYTAIVNVSIVRPSIIGGILLDDLTIDLDESIYLSLLYGRRKDRWQPIFARWWKP